MGLEEDIAGGHSRECELSTLFMAQHKNITTALLLKCLQVKPTHAVFPIQALRH